MKKHSITDDLLIDANGGEMSEELKQTMLDTQKVLAINVNTTYADADHDFINIDGVCVQHDIEKIPFAIRTYKTGYIYIAGSKKAHLIKVGSSNESKDRIKTLDISTTKNAGFDDWELLFQAKTTTLGKVERLFQSKLSEYKSSSQFEKGRKLQNGGELYRCSYNKAKEVMTPAEGEETFEFTQITEIRHLLSEYQFKNLRVKLPGTPVTPKPAAVTPASAPAEVPAENTMETSAAAPVTASVEEPVEASAVESAEAPVEEPAADDAAVKS